MRTAAVAFVALVAARASADDARATVTLTLDPCVAVDAADVRKIVELELRTTIAESGPTRITARCRDALVELVVEDSITGKSLTRSVDVMGAAPKARARLLALAITELVSASWTELETNPEPAVPPAGPPPPPAAKAAARDVARARVPLFHADARDPLRIVAVLDRRAFLARTAWVTGLGVRVAEDGRTIGWTAEMLASQGAARTELGEVALDVVGVALGATLGRSWSRWSARAAAGARLGAARLSGVPRDEQIESRSVRGVWGGPFLAASASFTPIAPLVIEVSFEGGYVALPVHARADGVRAASIGGVWVGGAIAIGVSL